MARHCDDSGQSWRSESTAADERRHDVDVRGRAPDEHAVFARYDPLDASMAHDGDDRIDGSFTRQQSAHTDQHPWGIQLTARMSRDLRECWDRGGEPNRGGLHRHGLSARHLQRPDSADEAIEVWKAHRDGRHHTLYRDYSWPRSKARHHDAAGQALDRGRVYRPNEMVKRTRLRTACLSR
jgi:hypothetical protein